MTVYVCILTVVIAGVIAYASLPREAAPDIEIPVINVMVTYEGVSPVDIEKNVTKPIEDKIHGIKGIKKISSTSSEGVSSISVEFETTIDIEDALQRVKDKVDQARGDIPPEADEPIVTEINISDFPILVVTLSGDAGLWKLKDIAEDLQDDVEGIEGVLEANVVGGLEQEIRVEFDPDRLAEFDIQLPELLALIAQENVNVTGGNIETGDFKFQVRVPSEIINPAEIDAFTVKTMPDGSHVYLTDVATIRLTHKDKTTISRLNGVESVALSVHKSSGKNIIRITDEVKRIAAEYQQRLPATLKRTDITDWPAFARTLAGAADKGDQHPLGRIWGRLDEPTRQSLAQQAETRQATLSEKDTLTAALNEVLTSPDLFTMDDFEKNRFVHAEYRTALLGDEARQLIERDLGTLETAGATRFNRFMLEALLPGTVARTIQFSLTHDMSDQIRTMVADLENSIVSGLVLVLIVLFIFLGWHNASLVALAIPLSMLMTFAALQLLGITLNMIVLFSLILALGMLVDCAIVVVENIHRHRQEGRSALEAAHIGTSEVAWPIITSTLTTVLAFAPLLMWEGLMGEFMSFLPKTVILTLIASLVVALLVNPMLCSRQRNVVEVIDQKKDGEHYGGFVKGYRSVLQWSLGHGGMILIVFGVVLVMSIFLFAKFGKGVELFPDIEPRRANVDIRAPQGTSLEKSDALVRQVEKRLEQFEDIEFVLSSVGERSSDFIFGGAKGTHESRVSVEFKERDQRSQSSNDTVTAIREAMRDLAGAEIEVEKEREGPPTGAPVTIELSGKDFDVLSLLADEIKEQIRPIDGLTDLKDNYEGARPELRFVVDRDRASQFGMRTDYAAQFLRMGIFGRTVGKYRTGEDEYDITIRLPEQYRNDISAILNIIVPNPVGLPIPFSSIAHVQYAGGQGAIRRVDRDRVITIAGNDSPTRRGPEILKDVEARLGELPLPPGYAINYAGEKEEQEKAQAFLLKAFIFAVLLIAIVLVTQFNSIKLPLIVISSVAMSLIGVFAGLLLTGTRFGIIMTGIGCISLAGVVVNNAIGLIDYIEKLRDWGYDKTEALLLAGTRRLRPVLLTAVTTVLGLIPLATGASVDFRSLFTGRWETVWQFGSESSQWWKPMAVAVIFGLAVATILTLVVVPCMYSMIAGKRPRHETPIGKATGSGDGPVVPPLPDGEPM